MCDLGVRSGCVPLLPLCGLSYKYGVFFLSHLWVVEYLNGNINSLYNPFQLFWIFLLAFSISFQVSLLVPIATESLAENMASFTGYLVFLSYPNSLTSSDGNSAVL